MAHHQQENDGPDGLLQTKWPPTSRVYIILSPTSWLGNQPDEPTGAKGLESKSQAPTVVKAFETATETLGGVETEREVNRSSDFSVDNPLVCRENQSLRVPFEGSMLVTWECTSADAG